MSKASGSFAVFPARFPMRSSCLKNLAVLLLSAVPRLAHEIQIRRAARRKARPHTALTAAGIFLG
jgi:hypothetical protein